MDHAEVTPFPPQIIYHLFNPLASYVDEKGDENPIMRHISISEIKKQLSKTKGRLAPGQDCIRYTVLKQCPEIVFANLEQTYNICLGNKQWEL